MVSKTIHWYLSKKLRLLADSQPNVCWILALKCQKSWDPGKTIFLLIAWLCGSRQEIAVGVAACRRVSNCSSHFLSRSPVFFLVIPLTLWPVLRHPDTSACERVLVLLEFWMWGNNLSESFSHSLQLSRENREVAGLGVMRHPWAVSFIVCVLMPLPAARVMRPGAPK